jgi:hypothetical protein
MATVRQQQPPASAKYDAFVETHLDRARRRIRLLDVSSALLLFLGATLAYTLAVGLLDRKLELSASARQLAFLGYAVAAVVFLAVGVVWPLCRRINPYYAARAVEDVLPGAKNSLVNWLDLHGETLPPAIRAALSQRAAKDLAHADLEQAISGRRAVWLTAVTALLAFATFGVLVSSGAGGFGTLLARTFAPFGGGATAKRTQLTLVRPANGDTILGVGQSFNVAVRVDGRVPDSDKPDALKLLYRYRDGEPYEEQTLDPENGNVWMTVLPPSRTFNGFWYQVTGGDAQTPEYRVTVRSTPLVERFDVTYHYRKYTGWADETSRDANLKALRGTEAELVVHTNRPVKDGRLEVETRDGKKAVPAELIADDPQAMRARLVMEQDGQYRVWFKTTDDDSNVAATTYTIAVLADLAPKAILTKPGADVTLPANGTLRVEGSASDDIGVKEVTLRLGLADGPALKPKPYRADKKFQLAEVGYPKTIDYRDFVALDQLKDDKGQPFPLVKGMVLEYWLEAADACDFPKPNRGESKHFKVNIVDPEKDQQQQKKDRDQAAAEQKKHEKEQDQKLKDEEQRRQQEAADKKEAQDKRNAEEQHGKDGTKPDEQPGKKSQEPKKNEGDQSLEDKAKQAKEALDKQRKEEQNQAEKGQCKGKCDGKGQGKGEGQQPGQQRGDAKPNGQNGDGKQGSGKDDGNKQNGKQPDTGNDKPEGAPHQGAAASDGKGEGKGGQQDTASAKPDGPPKPDPGAGKDEGKGDTSQGAATPKKHGTDPNGAKDEGVAKGPGRQTSGDPNDKATEKGDQPTVAKGAPKPGEAGGEPKGGRKGEGQPKGDGTKAGAKSGGQKKADGSDVARGESKDDPKQRGLGSELARREDEARRGTEKQSADADKWLENLARNAQDKEVRDLAKQILDDSRKDRASNPALPKDPPPESLKDGPPCQCKGGDGTKSGSAKPGEGKGKGAEKKEGEGKGTQGSAKTGGQGRGGAPTNIARSQQEMLQDKRADEAEPNPADPAHRRRAGVLQLEDFTKIDKNILKDLKMTPEEWEAFKKAYTAKVRREQAEQFPASRPDRLGSGASEYKTEKSGSSGDRTGFGQVPPELRNAFRNYTKGQSEKK